MSNSNDIYGWRCAEILGLGFDAMENILDDGELLLYNDYINMHTLHAKSEPRGSFTTKGKNYKNSFVRVKTENPKEIKYNVITVDGVNTELQLHYVAYKAGILKKKASLANIGGMKAPGPDSNAILFEGIQLAEDIVNPKATDVVEAVKEIWRYYKR